MDDRREFERHDLSQVVLFRRRTSRGSYLAGTLRNISEGGALFETVTSLSNGDEIELFFKKRTAFSDIRARGKVVHVSEMGHAYQIGVQFK